VRLVSGEVMPSLQRSLVGINSILYRELRKQSLVHPEGILFLDNAEITADYIKHRQAVGVTLSYRGKMIWKREIPVTANEVEFSSQMSDKDLIDQVTSTMRKHLNLVAQMHFARLEPMFPNSIEEVTMGFNPDTHTKTIHVKFKNGHVAEGPESEAKQDIFLARCAMLYDLPPLAR
jgi:hypothetical protein